MLSILLKLKNKFNKILKKDDCCPEVLRAEYHFFFLTILDKGHLEENELGLLCHISEDYFQKFVVKKDGVTLDNKELKDYVWTIANSGADKPTSDALMHYLRDKYFPVSSTIH